MKDWLRKAREEFDHIEQSEYGQLSDGMIRKNENLRSWSKKANELGASKGGKVRGGSKEGREWMREVQKISIGVPKTFSEEVRKKLSETGKATMSGEHAKRIKTMGGSVAGKISQQKERTCEHCNQTITGPLFFRWHGDKCKMKSNNLFGI